MILKEFSLEGKSAVIAGAGRNWTNALASCLAEAGANVALAGQNLKQMDEAAQAIKKFNRQTISVKTDLTNSKQVEIMANEVLAKWGKIDILVNAFDLQIAKPFLETTEEEWKKVMDTNLTATFVCTKAIGKHMVERKYGKIITISSGLAERGLPNSVAFCAAKGGVGQFTRALGLEWIQQNVTVNAIGLGWMTQQPEGSNDDPSDPLALHIPILVRYIPLRRLGRADDLCGALIYLASEASVYVTGQTFFVTGGVMAHG